MTPPPPPHTSVLTDEVREALARPDARAFLDGTVGGGGHAAALLEACPQALLLGLDRDPEALALARARLAPFGERARLERAPFAGAAEVVGAAGLGPFDGILLDLGVSSMQIDRPERGFSFQEEGPLDMRMDPEGEVTAQQLVETLPESALADLIFQLGEERYARRIARAIVGARAEGPLATTSRLAEVVWRAVPPPGRGKKGRPRGGKKGSARPRRLHPATRTFQALRLAVNEELEQLDAALPLLFELLTPGGRLAVISFHSLEDRRVKVFFRALEDAGRGRRVTRKPIRPGEAEVALNPRARSSKLRVAERGP